jgi:hypothetical protein
VSVENNTTASFSFTLSCCMVCDIREWVVIKLVPPRLRTNSTLVCNVLTAPCAFYKSWILTL